MVIEAIAVYTPRAGRPDDDYYNRPAFWTVTALGCSAERDWCGDAVDEVMKELLSRGLMGENDCLNLFTPAQVRVAGINPHLLTVPEHLRGA